MEMHWFLYHKCCASHRPVTQVFAWCRGADSCNYPDAQLVLFAFLKIQFSSHACFQGRRWTAAWLSLCGRNCVAMSRCCACHAFLVYFAESVVRSPPITRWFERRFFSSFQWNTWEKSRHTSASPRCSTTSDGEAEAWAATYHPPSPKQTPRPRLLCRLTDESSRWKCATFVGTWPYRIRSENC